MNPEKIQEQLIQSILSGEHHSALVLLREHALHAGFQATITNVLEPVLCEIGDRWSAGNISLAAGYLAGKITEEIMVEAVEAKQSLPETKGPVVVGNVEDDYHSLGRKLLSIFLRASGWKVIDLGNDVLASEFVDGAVAQEAQIIGVSAMMFTTASNISKIREELDHRGLSGRIKLAVGGAVFRLRPELVEELGADGTARSAAEAPELFDRLLKEACDELS